MRDPLRVGCHWFHNTDIGKASCPMCGIVFGFIYLFFILRVYGPDLGCMLSLYGRTLSQWQRVSVYHVPSQCSVGSWFSWAQTGIFCLVFSVSLLLKWRESSRLVGDLGSCWLLWLCLLCLPSWIGSRGRVHLPLVSYS